MLKAEATCSFDDKVISDTLSINRAAYPEGWAYDDAEEYYTQVLKESDNVHIMLRDNDKSVGFLLAIPHNAAVRELKEDDPSMRENASIYYIENVAILPAFRGRKGFSEMLRVLRRQLRKRAIFKISLHARVSNGLSKAIQKNMTILKIRRIDAWRYYNFEEPTDYIEAEWSC
jgi:ribosomal protein S18 acetylase RimI-like enzyme